MHYCINIVLGAFSVVIDLRFYVCYYTTSDNRHHNIFKTGKNLYEDDDELTSDHILFYCCQ